MDEAGPAADELAARAGQADYSDGVAAARYLTIPACVGCGSMRQEESCPAGCSETRRELVSAADYEQVAAETAASEARIGRLRPVAGELAGTEPAPGQYQAAYRRLQESARDVLRGPRPGPLPPPARTMIVWRCDTCGGLDAPQPCIEVCIWGQAAWADARDYRAERARAEAGRRAERALAALLRRLALTTPRAGHWEQSWRALQADARHVTAGPGKTGSPPGNR